MNIVHFNVIHYILYINAQYHTTFDIYETYTIYKAWLFLDVHKHKQKHIVIPRKCKIPNEVKGEIGRDREQVCAIYFNKLARIQFKFGYSESNVHNRWLHLPHGIEWYL